MATERLLESNELMIERFQPKQQHRFVLYMDGVPSWVVRTTTKPSVTINPLTIDYMNIKRKYAGKAEWGDITITLHDPIVPSAAQAVMEWVRLHHESLTGRDGYVDFYKKDLEMIAVGPPGDIVEKWRIAGAFINSAEFGSYDYSSDEVIEISLGITYDWAILEF